MLGKHQQYGVNCPAAGPGGLALLEYDNAKPVALIDYVERNPSEARRHLLRKAAEWAGIRYYCCLVTRRDSDWRFSADGWVYDMLGWVEFLHELRGRNGWHSHAEIMEAYETGYWRSVDNGNDTESLIEQFSILHKGFGRNCPAVEPGMIVANAKNEPLVIIKYMSVAARDSGIANMSTIEWFADKAKLPFLECHYPLNCAKFTPIALNDYGRKWLGNWNGKHLDDKVWFEELRSLT